MVVGEGYFPLLNNLFELNEGKFKTPLIRGSLRNREQKYSEFERMYRNNIDEWLCNMYFEVYAQQNFL